MPLLFINLLRNLTHVHAVSWQGDLVIQLFEVVGIHLIHLGSFIIPFLGFGANYGLLRGPGTLYKPTPVCIT